MSKLKKHLSFSSDTDYSNGHINKVSFGFSILLLHVKINTHICRTFDTQVGERAEKKYTVLSHVRSLKLKSKCKIFCNLHDVLPTG